MQEGAVFNNLLFAEENSTNFPLSVQQNIAKIEYDEKEYLKYPQFVVKEYFTNRPNSRGILIYHDPGTGKTILAVSIASHYSKYEPSRKVIIMASKSLHSNFQANIEKYKRSVPDAIIGKYSYVSLNASNMYEQMLNAKKGQSELELEKGLGVFTSTYSSLENTLLIIDEFHNLSNSITNGSKNATALYNTIMRTKNIKLVFLTGTPIINNPFELVPTFNMLRGYIAPGITLFPENIRDFYKYFIDVSNEEYTIKNKGIFLNRIYGFISYYTIGTESQKNYAEELPLIVEKIPMSIYQFARYNEARDIEKREESNRFQKGKPLTDGFIHLDGKSGSSSYRIRSRQISNFLIPEYALKFSPNRRSVEKFISAIKEEDLDNLDKFSPKFSKMLQNIQSFEKKNGACVGFVYSEFVSGEGLNLFARVLDQNGYASWDKENDKQKKYAIISGDVMPTIRQQILNIFNSDENKHGKLISLLLISKTGAEGLSLRNIRHIHIMEPFWNYSRILQVIARGRRFMGHLGLPPKERIVQPYIYISTPPISYKLVKSKDPEKTTDEELLHGALQNLKLNNQFEVALIEASFDCPIHLKSFSKDVQCMTCAPNGARLYTEDIRKDIKKPNPCEALESKKVDAQEIIIKGNPDRTYYYSNDDELNVFKYDETLDGYVKLPKHSPEYIDVMRAL